ncbi:hypothetical protein GCM10010215_74580 [Streptomyces virginiae]|uniref:Uncharacterized protein n=1 Tax=Streptomyces virginiae TaxID=1961 RepID=A0ABQ3P0M0_STRVG|nr:hypothetical protein GCM10010215_74580 [Streptomyces virginiae]GHI18571.1 hypothetical protein Scinn_80340 [Streptomyces virginiae]
MAQSAGSPTSVGAAAATLPQPGAGSAAAGEPCGPAGAGIPYPPAGAAWTGAGGAGGAGGMGMVGWSVDAAGGEEVRA